MSTIIRNTRKALGGAAVAVAGSISSLALAAGNVDINSANEAELITLTGIGPTLAEAIIEHRELHGPFENVHDLTRVSGIGPVTIARNKETIAVGGQAVTD